MILQEEKLNLVAAVHQNLVFHLVTVFCVTQGKTVNTNLRLNVSVFCSSCDLCWRIA